MALPSFLQHLGVLERAGVVTSTKAGRVRTYRLNPRPLEAAEDWLAKQHELWQRRLDQFDEYVRSLADAEKETPT
jgi:DNA-binding transcriptional ArsR family regulator